MLAKLVISEIPILIGFQWDYSLIFQAGDQPEDLDDYNIYFAVQMDGDIVVPSVQKFPDGLAVITFTGEQTISLVEGEWRGNLFLENKQSKNISYITNVFASAIKVAPTPLP